MESIENMSKLSIISCLCLVLMMIYILINGVLSPSYMEYMEQQEEDDNEKIQIQQNMDVEMDVSAEDYKPNKVNINASK